ncbi:hypothetical protein [Flavobacterium sp.]|uniref:hypothetical protein n=1 Tax=Flavobacterium sp. TaxID=239 RepID=UPI0035ADC927
MNKYKKKQRSIQILYYICFEDCGFFLQSDVMAHYKDTTMTRFSLLICLIFFTFGFGFGQNKNLKCDCPKTQFAGEKADTIFYLANNKSIVLCGFKNPNRKPATYSEFILAICGQDTIIDFWGAVLTCRLRVSKDTLLIDQLQNLPTGKDFGSQETIWMTEKIYFNGHKTLRKSFVNRQITKYNAAQIKQVLQAYLLAKPAIDESKMEIASKLFIATLSGDKIARQYFAEFKTKFILDGAFAEEYNDLTLMLKQWDEK